MSDFFQFVLLFTVYNKKYLLESIIYIFISTYWCCKNYEI